MDLKLKIKKILYQLSIIFFTLSFLTIIGTSNSESVILKTHNENIPKQLFDITFNIYKNQIGDIEQLSGYGTFENFGYETTQLQYTLILYDSNVQKVLSVDKIITVQSQESLSFEFEEFKDLELEPGKYSIVLSTIYNTDVKDIFIQDFYISNFYKDSIQFILFVVFTILIFFTMFFIVFEVKKGKTKKENKLIIKEYLIKNKKKKLKPNKK